MLTARTSKPAAQRTSSGALQTAPPSAPLAASAPSRAAGRGHSLAAVPIQARFAHSSLFAPIQPGWEFVQIGGRVRKYNLRDNKDGTFTHSGSGEVYQHQGQRHSNGERVLEPVVSNQPPTTTPQPQVGSTTVHDPKNVLFGFTETGKVTYLGNTAQNRQQHAGKYLEMSPKDFALFKAGGKRRGSSKVMDPVTLERYHYDEGSKQFYRWDAKKAGGKGDPVSTKGGPNKAPSPNQELLDRLEKEELVDRRRKDRSNKGLLPFDVGPYKSDLTLSSESDPKRTYSLPKLTGIEAWTSKGNQVNRDHVPSGESLNQRGDSGAYNQGITIAIPNPELHQTFSPTFGTDNSTSKGYMDEVDGDEIRRVKFDTKNPGTAALRDTQFMLDSTEDQDYSDSHDYLNLAKPKYRLRQIGSYRYLNRQNAKLYTKYGKRRGFNPKATGHKIEYVDRVIKKPNSKKPTKRKVGGFRYTELDDGTVGEQFAKVYRRHLLRTKRVKKI